MTHAVFALWHPWCFWMCIRSDDWWEWVALRELCDVDWRKKNCKMPGRSFMDLDDAFSGCHRPCPYSLGDSHCIMVFYPGTHTTPHDV